MQYPDRIPLTGFLDTKNRQIVFDLPAAAQLGTGTITVQAPVDTAPPAQRKPQRPANRGDKATTVDQLPYACTLAPALAFTLDIINGGAEHEIGGQSKLTDDQVLQAYNADPKGWFDAARWAERCRGIASPSSLICLHRVGAKRGVDPTPFFDELLQPKTPAFARFVQQVSTIGGEGRRVEQLRALLIEFRRSTGMRPTRPIFPHLAGPR